ncbi:dihydroorotase [candidate division KSB1 bacterium]
MDPDTGRDEVIDILVVDQDIEAIGSIEAKSEMNVIDATGKLVMPGIVDLHVHLRDMEQSHKETIETGTKAARKGGVTTVFTMPNTNPPLDSAENIKKYLDLIKGNARVDTHIVGAITKEQLGKELADIDIYPEFNIRFISDDGFDIDDADLLKKAYEKANSLDLTIMTHPEIHSIAPKGVINEGKVSEKLGVEGQPNKKEWQAIERGVKIALEVKAKAHFTHISTLDSVKLLRDAKKLSHLITCDATPHHFCLTEDEVLKQGSMAKVNPPLRTKDDRLAIIEGIKDGTIDAIVTDHAPHAENEKTDDLIRSAFGFSELEVMLPASITELHYNQKIDLMKVISLLTIQPARLANLRVGRLQVGFPADITIVDLNEEHEVDRNKFVSKGKNTPFHGKKLKGWPVMTIVKGAVYK